MLRNIQDRLGKIRDQFWNKFSTLLTSKDAYRLLNLIALTLLIQDYIRNAKELDSQYSLDGITHSYELCRHLLGEVLGNHSMVDEVLIYGSFLLNGGRMFQIINNLTNPQSSIPPNIGVIDFTVNHTLNLLRATYDLTSSKLTLGKSLFNGLFSPQPLVEEKEKNKEEKNTSKGFKK